MLKNLFQILLTLEIAYLLAWVVNVHFLTGFTSSSAFSFIKFFESLGPLGLFYGSVWSRWPWLVGTLFAARP